MAGYVVRISLPDRPGALGLVASRIGAVGGDIVAIILRHAPDLYFSFLGAMLAGCTPTFVSSLTAGMLNEFWSA